MKGWRESESFNHQGAKNTELTRINTGVLGAIRVLAARCFLDASPAAEFTKPLWADGCLSDKAKVVKLALFSTGWVILYV